MTLTMPVLPGSGPGSCLWKECGRPSLPIIVYIYSNLPQGYLEDWSKAVASVSNSELSEAGTAEYIAWKHGKAVKQPANGWGKGLGLGHNGPPKAWKEKAEESFSGDSGIGKHLYIKKDFRKLHTCLEKNWEDSMLSAQASP